MTQITEQISLYADNVLTEANGKDQLRVIITGINVDQVVAEFSIKEILDAITNADGFVKIADYVTEGINEEAEKE